MRYLFTFLLIGVSLTHVFSQPAVGIHPFDKEFSIRSNQQKNHFWDFRTSFDYGSMEGYGYFKYRIETTYNRRPLNQEQVKLYYGIGLAIQDFMPQMLLPFGIEVFPLLSAQRLSLATEIIPSINFAYFRGLSLSSDLAVRYYF